MKPVFLGRYLAGRNDRAICIHDVPCIYF
ncbi:hypothetical protein AvCA_24950 [Azotobacter vinelandii CA]|uniref:Uncharacterized protein n=2 Tax=Azotobacter vinelandii TaxID=354 RepID=C1DIJ8_AZOVD|nr:hypothetical protein Avin_24950 [Azotobacter vinelandii DJ]AGK14944.1 hypothetical protein AvCA_24950 [Azotobacter vinelandii CA]AGK20652.1 hypothetical protein AvCA6_24950 [Azotobacter vinelandii CA6]